VKAPAKAKRILRDMENSGGLLRSQRHHGGIQLMTVHTRAVKLGDCWVSFPVTSPPSEICASWRGGTPPGVAVAVPDSTPAAPERLWCLTWLPITCHSNWNGWVKYDKRAGLTVIKTNQEAKSSAGVYLKRSSVLLEDSIRIGQTPRQLELLWPPWSTNWR
jgi:hypothetical protein